MNKFKLESFYRILVGLRDKTLPGVKFNYALIKNINLITPEVEANDKVKSASKPYMDYQEKRVELAKKYAAKDEEGNPIILNNVFQGLDGNQEFIKELDVLNKESEASLKEIDDFMRQEVLILDFPYKIKLEDIPEEIMKEEGGMNSIFELIES